MYIFEKKGHKYYVKFYNISVYTIVRPPEEGHVMRIQEVDGKQKKRRIQANNNFTQVAFVYNSNQFLRWLVTF